MCNMQHCLWHHCVFQEFEIQYCVLDVLAFAVM
jgi:hypothetical protein